MTKKNSLLASGLSLSFLTLLSRILGLIRETTKGKFLGTSDYADAFTVAFMIPNLFRRLFAENSISVAFIPTFKSYLEDSNTEEGHIKTQEFIYATFSLVSFATALVVIIGMIFSPWIVKVFYSGDNQTVLAETAVLTKIMFPYLFVISVAAFFQGILNGVKIFAPSGFTPVLFNAIVVAATYILSPVLGGDSQAAARAMSIGVIIGGTVQALFQLPFVIKTGWKVAFTGFKKIFSNPGTKRVLVLIVPTILGMAAYQLNDVVSTALAGRAGTGVVSSLQYSLRLQELILGVFVVSVGTVILPDLTGLAKKEQWESFNKMLSQAIKIIALITVPVSVYAFISGKEIISLVYKERSFDDESVRLTLEAFHFHIIGLFFIAENRIISQAFYAMGNTARPAISGVLSFVVNIALALILVSPMAGGGIALALTVASFANTILLLFFLAKSKNIDVSSISKGLFVYLIKLCIFSAIAAVPIIFVLPKLNEIFADYGRFIKYGVPLFSTVAIFALCGILLLLITNDEIIVLIKNRLRRKNS